MYNANEDTCTANKYYNTQWERYEADNGTVIIARVPTALVK